MNQTRIQCDLPKRQYDRFRTLAKDSDRSVSGHLRHVVKTYIAHIILEHETEKLNEEYNKESE